MVEFAQSFCLAEVDRLAVAIRIVPPTWSITKNEASRDITLGVDAPTARHDRLERAWEGPVAGGTAWVDILHWDEADPGRRDTSWANFGVSPGTLVDLAELQRRVPIRLEPAGPPRHGTRDMPQVQDEKGQPYPRQPASYEWDQRYFGITSRPNPDVDIKAVHLYGNGPLRKFWMQCDTSPDRAR
jgi:hypothetical protein